MLENLGQQFRLASPGRNGAKCRRSLLRWKKQNKKWLPCKQNQNIHPNLEDIKEAMGLPFQLIKDRRDGWGQMGSHGVSKERERKAIKESRWNGVRCCCYCTLQRGWEWHNFCFISFSWIPLPTIHRRVPSPPGSCDSPFSLQSYCVNSCMSRNFSSWDWLILLLETNFFHVVKWSVLGWQSI